MKRAQLGPQHLDFLLEELLEADDLLHRAVAIPRDAADDRAAALLVALEVLTGKAQTLKRIMNRQLSAGLALEARAANGLLALPEFCNAELVLPDLATGESPDLILRQPEAETLVKVCTPRSDLVAAADALTKWAVANAPRAHRVLAVVGARPRQAPELPAGIGIRWVSQGPGNRKRSRAMRSVTGADGRMGPVSVTAGS